MFRKDNELDCPWEALGALVGGSMTFDLEYVGPLRSAQQDASQGDFKTKLRHHFSKQLLNIWKAEPALVRWDSGALPLADWKGNRGVLRDPNSHLVNRPFYAVRVGRGFVVPIISRFNQLSCKLDIQIMRRQDPGVFTGQGDLDGMIKTLIDGLAMPQDISSLSPHLQGDMDTFFCLLEDDSLVTRACVEARRIHTDPEPGHESDIRAMIQFQFYPLHAVPTNVELAALTRI